MRPPAVTESALHVAVRIVRLGSPRKRGEGLRLGTVRRPPRGVPKAEFSRRDYYDLWVPALAPSSELVAQAKSIATAAQWKAFARAFRRELRESNGEAMLDLLAALSHHADFSVGCYCEDETRCHRSILREMLAERGAKITA